MHRRTGRTSRKEKRNERNNMSGLSRKMKKGRDKLSPKPTKSVYVLLEEFEKVKETAR